MDNPRFVTAQEARELVNLSPVARPENPEFRCIYTDKDDGHLYYWDGQSWNQLDSKGAPPATG